MSMCTLYLWQMQNSLKNHLHHKYTNRTTVSLNARVTQMWWRNAVVPNLSRRIFLSHEVQSPTPLVMFQMCSLFNIISHDSWQWIFFKKSSKLGQVLIWSILAYYQLGEKTVFHTSTQGRLWPTWGPNGHREMRPPHRQEWNTFFGNKVLCKYNSCLLLLLSTQLLFYTVR